MRSLNLVFLMVSYCSAFAQASEEKKEVSDKGVANVGHCEKMKADGTEEDIEAKDKSDCKSKGGKWSKHAKGEDHGHGTSGHKH